MQIWGSATKSNLQKDPDNPDQDSKDIVHSPWYRRNTTILNNINIPPIRTIIKNQANNFFDNIPTIPNTALHNISNWDERVRLKRQRATLHLPENTHTG